MKKYNKVFLLFLIIIFQPVNLYCDNLEKCHSINSKEKNLEYCQLLVDSYTFILQSYEKRYVNKSDIDSDTIDHINNINKKIKQYKLECGLNDLSTDVHITLLSKT